MKEYFLKFLLTVQFLTILLFIGNLETRIVYSDCITYDFKSNRYLSKHIYDFSKVTDIKQRKKLFIDYMSLIIDTENDEIIANRLKILELKEKKELTQKNLNFINNIEKVYLLKISATNKDVNWIALLSRVDEIPRELAIAQAAIESGWGTSGFAKRANNIFGHWTYKVGSGLVPNERKPGMTHEIALFDSVNDSVKKYLLNLNTNNAYKKLRVLRSQMRTKNTKLKGEVLSAGLRSYSEMGNDYIRLINSMMSDISKIMESQ